MPDHQCSAGGILISPVVRLRKMNMMIKTLMKIDNFTS